jgi:hypothetical protein
MLLVGTVVVGLAGFEQAPKSRTNERNMLVRYMAIALLEDVPNLLLMRSIRRFPGALCTFNHGEEFVV